MDFMFCNDFLDEEDSDLEELMELSSGRTLKGTSNNSIYNEIKTVLSCMNTPNENLHTFSNSSNVNLEDYGNNRRFIRKKKSLRGRKFKINPDSSDVGENNFLDSDLEDEQIHKFLRSQKKRELDKMLPRRRLDHLEKLKELRNVIKYEEKSPEEFFEHLRVTRKTYKILLDKLQSENLFTHNKHGGNLPITPDQALQMFLYYMGHKCTYNYLSDVYHISESAIMLSFVKCVEAINKMDDDEVKWPSFEEMESVQNDFKSISGIPGVVGSLGSCCIEMRTSKEPPAGYKIDKKRSIMHLLGVVDTSLRFIYLQAGFPGTFSVQEAFESSSLGEMIKDNASSLFPSDDYHIVGDSDFTLHQHLLAPYSISSSLNEIQDNFNIKLLATNISIKAFERLLGRFSSLQTQIYANLEKIPNIVKACCIIHNISMRDSDDEQLLTKNLVFNNVDYSLYRDDTDFIPNKPDSVALTKRDLIAQKIK